MTSVTIAVSDHDHPVPGFAVEMVADTFFMHEAAVRMWIAEERQASSGDPSAAILVADPGWVNPGDGTHSLTFWVEERDAEVVACHWARLKASIRRAAETHD
jgi:hypothetical protein